MKISKLELVCILLAVAFLSFSAGWFLRSSTAAQPVWVETERTLAQETPLAVPTPTPTPEGTEGPSGLVNINTAGMEELMSLPGIGEKRAADILADRAANGPFRYPEELTRVSGIGEGILAGLIDYITVE